MVCALGGEVADMPRTEVVTMGRRFVVSAALLAGLLVLGGLTSASAAPTPPKEKAHRAAAGPPPAGIPRLETSYVPIRPCRIADTRSSTAGIVKRGTVRTFVVRGSTGFVDQGGTAGGCGVPADATGVTVNTTITGPTGSGYMTSYPVGTPLPLSNFVFYNRGVIGTSNPTFSLAAAGTEPSISVHTSTGADAHLIIDVTGYYLPQVEALVDPAGSISSGSPRVLSAARLSTGSFLVKIDSDVTHCSPTAHPYYRDEYASASTNDGPNVFVDVWKLGSTHVETPVDDYFYLSVSC